MEMSEYDEDEDFLKIQESFFEERLDSLGPDLGEISFICSIRCVNYKHFKSCVK